jgi:chemotaxis protein methyltransferase CheR
MIEEDPNFKRILAYLFTAKGFNGHHYKINYIKRRIAVRMRATGANNYSDYLRNLQNDRQEPSHLLDRLTIHVTEFFRDPGVYRAVQDKILPDFKNTPGKKIKVWCAGCSTGEEPYSVAILLSEWSADHAGTSFEIFATDLDTTSVKTAERGEYPREALKKIHKGQAARWFQSDASKAWVSPELKNHIRFRVHDLLGKWVAGLSEFHVVFCRNLLIYLTGSQQQKLYEQFTHVLNPGGYLVLGLTETLLGPARRYYRCVDVKHRIYQMLEKPRDLDLETGIDG